MGTVAGRDLAAVLETLGPGRTIVYAGEIEEADLQPLSAGGWRRSTRLIGGPLPTGRETKVPIIVTVTEDAKSGGQIWTRLCARSSGFPQVIHSAKRFAGPTGLEEYVGCGIGMALNISVEHEALVFRSAGYFLEIGPLRLALPEWLTPGAMTVAISISAAANSASPSRSCIPASAP